MEKRNDIVLREELAEKEYNENEFRKIDVQVTRLRQKIEKNPKLGSHEQSPNLSQALNLHSKPYVEFGYKLQEQSEKAIL